MEVGFSQGDFVLDGDPAPPCPKRGRSPPILSPYLLWPNGYMYQHTTWYGVDLGPGHIVLDGFPALRERGAAPLPSLRPMSIVATVAHLSYC